MFEKLLCATDGSHSAAKAVELAARWAKKTGAKLTFLTVSTVSSQSAAKTYFWDTRLLGAGDALVHAELGQAQRAAQAEGIEAECVMTSGRDIASAIVSYAGEHGFDHLVVGSAGRSGLQRLVLGSVAAEVIAKAHCPVTVVR